MISPNIYLNESTTGSDASVEAAPNTIWHEATCKKWEVIGAKKDTKSSKSIKLMAAALNS